MKKYKKQNRDELLIQIVRGESVEIPTLNENENRKLADMLSFDYSLLFGKDRK